MTNERRKLMSDTRDRIQKEFKRLRVETNLNTSVADRMFFLMDKRFNSPGIRSFFVNTIYQYVVEQAKLENLELKDHDFDTFNTKILLVAESIITIQYYHNQILDGKGGVCDTSGKCNKKKIDRNLIAGNFVKDFLFKYIENSIFPEDLERARILSNEVRRIFEYVDLGQDMQDHWGTSQSYVKNMNQYNFINQDIDDFVNKEYIDKIWEIIHAQGVADDKEWFVRNYLLRINITSASLFVILAELIMNLLGYYGKERRNIIAFSTFNNIIGQIVNDIDDFVLPEAKVENIGKIPEDAFADLRNDNITLPFVFYLQKDKKNINNLEKMQKSFNLSNVFIASMNMFGLGWSGKIKWLVKHIFYSFISLFYPNINYIGYKEEIIRRIQQEFFPAIEKSMEVAKAMATKVENDKLINLENKFGLLLLDMNSITKREHNHCYQHIYAGIEMNRVAGKKLYQPPFTGWALGVTISTIEYIAYVGKYILSAAWYLGNSLVELIVRMDNWCIMELYIPIRISFEKAFSNFLKVFKRLHFLGSNFSHHTKQSNFIRLWSMKL